MLEDSSLCSPGSERHHSYNWGANCPKWQPSEITGSYETVENILRKTKS